MAKIDEIKEEIGWLKFWIGVIAASFMGMVSYINSNYDQMSSFSLILSILATLALVFGAFNLNQKAIRLIRSLKDL